MGNFSCESREQNRKDKVTGLRSVTYVRQQGLLVNTLGSHLKLWCRCAREQCSGAFRSVVCNLSIGRFIFGQLKLSVFCSVNLFLPVVLELFILGGLECKMVKKTPRYETFCLDFDIT